MAPPRILSQPIGIRGDVFVVSGDLWMREINTYTGGGDTFTRNIWHGNVGYSYWHDNTGTRTFGIGHGDSSHDQLSIFVGSSPVGTGDDSINIRFSDGGVVIPLLETTTQSPGDNSVKAASTAFVHAATSGLTPSFFRRDDLTAIGGEVGFTLSNAPVNGELNVFRSASGSSYLMDPATDYSYSALIGSFASAATTGERYTIEYRTAATPAASTLLSNSYPSDYATFAAAYGIKLMINGYTGPLIRVRRSSDNTETDIGSISGGRALDTSALSAFVTTNSGYVTKMYDQTGNGLDLVQTTSAYQPMIVNAGSVLTAVTWDGNDDWLLTASPVGSGSNTARTVVGKFSMARTASSGVTAMLFNNGYTFATNGIALYYDVRGSYLGYSLALSTVGGYDVGSYGGSIDFSSLSKVMVVFDTTFSGSVHSKLWLNGSAQSGAPQSIAPPSGNIPSYALIVGNYTSASSGGGNCTVESFLIADGDLSSSLASINSSL